MNYIVQGDHKSHTTGNFHFPSLTDIELLNWIHQAVFRYLLKDIEILNRQIAISKTVNEWANLKNATIFTF